MKKLLLAAIVSSALCMVAVMAQGANGPVPAAQAGVAQAGPAQEIVASQLPTMTAAQMAAAKGIPTHPNPHFSGSAYQAAKMAASQATTGSRQQDAASGLMSPPRSSAADVGIETPGAKVNILGQLQGCNGLTWTPSDMGLAVSKTFVVQTVNECFSVYNKTGGLLLGPVDLCTFFGRAPNSGSAGCFDPRAIYDAQKNKFIIIASFFDSASGTGFIDLAASKTSNPTGAWTVYHISRGASFPDYPTVGQTAYNNNTLNAIITVCDNNFPNAGGFTSECLLLPKTPIYKGAGFSFNFFFGFNLGGKVLDTLQPANVFAVDENPRAQYAINTVNYNGTDGFCAGGASKGLVVWSFSDATGSQGPKVGGVYTGCNTTGYNFPGAADNAGFCAGCIETIDNRITGTVHYSGGRLYPSIDANNGGKSAVLGWVVRPFLTDNGAACTGGVNCATISAAAIEQEWCYDCGAGSALQAYFGSQAPTSEGDWTMFATFSNTGTSPGMFYQSNRVSSTALPHDSGIFSCQVNHAYTGGGGGVARWGDYSAAYPDEPGKGNIPGTWGSGMFVQSSGLWGTCITENRPSDAP